MNSGGCQEHCFSNSFGQRPWHAGLCKKHLAFHCDATTGSETEDVPARIAVQNSPFLAFIVTPLPSGVKQPFFSVSGFAAPLCSDANVEHAKMLANLVLLPRKVLRTSQRTLLRRCQEPFLQG